VYSIGNRNYAYKQSGVNTMKFLVPTVLILLSSLSSTAEEISFAKVVKASLLFRDDFNAERLMYPHILNVYLRLDNLHDSNVTWVANGVEGVEAELLDAAGKPVPHPPVVASIQSNTYSYMLPVDSRLDWLISHGGISMIGDAKDKYALMVGCQGWLIPIETAESYTLRIRLHGLPWTGTDIEIKNVPLKLLLDLPPTKIKVTSGPTVAILPATPPEAQLK